MLIHIQSVIIQLKKKLVNLNELKNIINWLNLDCGNAAGKVTSYIL